MTNLVKIKCAVNKCKTDLGISREKMKALAEQLETITEKLTEIENRIDKKREWEEWIMIKYICWCCEYENIVISQKNIINHYCKSCGALTWIWPKEDLTL